MFDAIQHQLEIRLLAVRRWQDELGRTDEESDPVRRAARRQEALRMIEECWDGMIELLNHDGWLVTKAVEFGMPLPEPPKEV